ncbi:hypothetical protein [Paraferrimonas sp. SM1919]|uniref:hypothetical protein n=1 Tax=Paraferrimonas sp. SM1919 TaxID=2662263 RepID=UPI0013D4D8E9|nr:hypothetical protein [Paraferrimonas sp. SM1919]
MNKFISLALLLLCLTGCASTKTIKESYSLNDKSGNGVLISSVSNRGGYSGYSVFYRGISNGISGNIKFGEGVALLPIPPKGDFSHLNRKGEVFAVELPAGNYKVWRWGVSSGHVFLKPIVPIAIEFKVEPGKATYIGNFDFIQTDSMGLTVTGVEVNYSDQSQIDLDIVSKKYPNLDAKSIIKGVKDDAVYLGLGGSNRTSWNIPLGQM